MLADGDADVEEWLRSSEVRKRFHLTTCQLAHLRTSGGIRFRKAGNAYLYSVLDCARIAIRAKRPPQAH
jgi:hypothetical protein